MSRRPDLRKQASQTATIQAQLQKLLQEEEEAEAAQARRAAQRLELLRLQKIEVKKQEGGPLVLYREVARLEAEVKELKKKVRIGANASPLAGQMPPYLHSRR
ncbi:hypothetical protein EG329_013596 [Mollisiaceae sp. DMI_Dod_QoI]|nr:hypothetical protein EG329_013596 [Helotiales sp. DMI_Dod_QoI]